MIILIIMSITASIIIGINLIEPTNSWIEGTEMASDLSSTLLLIFVALLILGTVACLGYGYKEKTEKKSSNQIIAKAKSYINRNKKLSLFLVITGIISLALYLLSYI